MASTERERERERGNPRANWPNRTLFQGDNLDFLRAMNSESVHLIATDPPFNKGRDFHATPDSLARGASFQDRWSWERDVHQEWVDKITDDFPAVMNVIQGSRSSYGDNMGAYLCFMAVRLLEMRRVLREDGSLYLHCDPTASHYLKELLDSIFGLKNFRNEIVWLYKTGGVSKRWFGRKHDLLLFYSKTNAYSFTPLQEKSYLSHQYGFKNITIHKDEKGLYRNVYMRDVWDIPALRGNQPETTGHPTQKPIRLYERIIRASSSPGDTVLDPFCGCATTLVAAERHRRNWVGVDIWKGARDLVIDRLRREAFASGPTTQPGQSNRLQFDASAITHVTYPPTRTDDGDEAVPFLLVRERVREPRDEYSTNASRREFLLRQYGPKCQGCDRLFDDARYLELDHNTPRSDGGWNHISNRILLCGPCNRLKSNVYTLSGLRRENRKRGYMAKGER